MTMRRAGGRNAVRAALALALLAVPFASQGGASHTSDPSEITVRRIGAGAFYKKIVKPRKHWVIHMITVNLRARSTIDVALAGGSLGNTEVLSSIASRSGAIAAINGDFGSRYKRPLNAYAQDGHLIQTETTYGRAVSVSAKGTAFIGHPEPRVKLRPDGGELIKINRVNSGRPGPNEVALFTRAARAVEKPPTDACSARLLRRSKLKFNEFGAVTQRYEVDAARCDYDAMGRRKGMVVSARREGSRGEEILALAKGQRGRLTWSMDLEQTVDMVGGNPLIVDNGKVIKSEVYDCGYLCQLHPRTAAAVTKDDKLLMVVVDGRALGVRGMYLHQLARFLARRGAERAMTFDGGGASEMWIRGDVVNTPSDGRERPGVNALLLLPGKDEHQPVPMGSTATYGARSLDEYETTASRVAEEQAFEASAEDSASLGGLADYLKRRGHDLPEWMDEVARNLRAAEAG